MRFSSKIIKKANNKITVALSSGCDSVAVTHFLKTKYPKIELKCFHYNHNLRNQNLKMVKKAEKLCSDLDIPLTVKMRDSSHMNASEADLRALRYGAMAGMGYVLTGHHLDDAVENYLYNCFNGTPEYLPIPLETEYKDLGLTILRPFILSSKIEIENYIKNNKLEKYVENDETNKDESYRRNWLRNNLIPQVNEKGYNLQTVVKKRYHTYLNKKGE